jgi:hypothetical protein
MNPLLHEWSATVAFLVIGSVFAFLLAPLFRRDAFLRKLVPAIILWRLIVFAFHVFWMLPYYASRDSSDAVAYHLQGSNLSESLADGLFASFRWVNGSSTIVFLTGLAYRMVGPSIYGMYWISAIAGVGASLFFFLAFREWYGGVAAKAYAMLILFLPSYALFTTLYGKDSLVSLGMGLSTYGFIHWLRHRHSKGIVFLTVGLALVGSVRPHVAGALIFAAMVANIAFIGRGNQSRHTAGRTSSLVFFGLLSIAGWFGVRTFTFGQTEAAGEQAIGLMRHVQSGNQVGGSSIEITEVTDFSDLVTSFPNGVLTVLLRPFPWEADGVNMLMASLENLLLLAILIRAVRQKKMGLRATLQDPYLVFCGSAAVALLVILARFPNLGLVLRERAMFQPFYFALLVAPRRGVMLKMAKVVPNTPLRAVGRRFSAVSIPPVHSR